MWIQSAIKEEQENLEDFLSHCHVHWSITYKYRIKKYLRIFLIELLSSISNIIPSHWDLRYAKKYRKYFLKTVYK